jgi:hypothetical protein
MPLILDTNVFLEIVAMGDLYAEGEKVHARGEVLAASPDYRNRQLRSRCSTLLAWHCTQHNVTTSSLVEFKDILTGKVAPRSEPSSYAFTRIFAHALKERLFGGWVTQRVGSDAKGHRADSEYLQIAKNTGDPLITNEGVTSTGYDEEDKRKLRARGRVAGVQVYSPLEYLTSIGFDIRVESERFIEECERVVGEIYDEGLFTTEIRTLEMIPDLYRFILFDEVDPAYEHIRMPSISWYPGS